MLKNTVITPICDVIRRTRKMDTFLSKYIRRKQPSIQFGKQHKITLNNPAYNKKARPRK